MNSNHTHGVSSKSLDVQALSLAPSEVLTPAQPTLRAATVPGRPANHGDGTSHEAINVASDDSLPTTTTLPNTSTQGSLLSTRPGAGSPSIAPGGQGK
jgi:hypothetical protein